MQINTLKKTFTRAGKKLAGLAILAALSTGIAYADQQPGGGAATRAAGMITEGLDANGQLTLMVGKSVVLSSARTLKRVSISVPDVAEVNVVGANSLLVTAKKAGSTQLVVWDENERSQVIDVNVRVDISSLQDQLKVMFPQAKLEVAASGSSIVLRGRAPNLTIVDQAQQMAASMGKVMNFVEVAGGQQVMLQVRFAEVSRSAVSNLGVNGLITGPSFVAGSNVGQVNAAPSLDGTGVGSQSVNSAVTLFGGGQIGSYHINVFLNALRQNNLLRILAEPNLVAISGQEASFLAGGEFPIPVTQGGGGGSGGTSVTVEFREFGVKLNFVPVVLGDGRIRLKVAPEVSDLDFTTAVRFNGFVIPGLTQRKVSTVIELTEGQTFAVAGLLNNSTTATKDVTPLLGDIPVLGALFRSVRYQRKETELVVLVTPRLVEGMNPDQVPPVPGEQWRAPNENELFWKQDLGAPVKDTNKGPNATNKAGGPAPKFYGSYGFTPAATAPAAGSSK